MLERAPDELYAERMGRGSRNLSQALLGAPAALRQRLRRDDTPPPMPESAHPGGLLGARGALDSFAPVGSVPGPVALGGVLGARGDSVGVVGESAVTVSPVDLAVLSQAFFQHGQHLAAVSLGNALAAARQGTMRLDAQQRDEALLVLHRVHHDPLAQPAMRRAAGDLYTRI
jgi:hypothetical protein